MAVTIRLQRFGAKKRPFYRFVAADRRAPRDGRFLEQLGTYDPMQDPAGINLETDRVDYGVGGGAQPGGTVASLSKKFGRAGAGGPRGAER